MVKITLLDGDPDHAYFTTDSPAIGEALEEMREVGCEGIVAVNVTDTGDGYHCQAMIRVDFSETQDSRLTRKQV